jgi:hypothetical protein
VSLVITVDRDWTFDTLPILPTVDEMRDAALLLRETIVRETRQGLDGNGMPFAPYSPGYARKKEGQLGSVFAGHGGYGTVDLTVSGNMLNQIAVTAVEAGPDSVRFELGWNT